MQPCCVKADLFELTALMMQTDADWQGLVMQVRLGSDARGTSKRRARTGSTLLACMQGVHAIVQGGINGSPDAIVRHQSTYQAPATGPRCKTRLSEVCFTESCCRHLMMQSALKLLPCSIFALLLLASVQSVGAEGGEMLLQQTVVQPVGTTTTTSITSSSTPNSQAELLHSNQQSSQDTASLSQPTDFGGAGAADAVFRISTASTQIASAGPVARQEPTGEARTLPEQPTTIMGASQSTTTDSQAVNLTEDAAGAAAENWTTAAAVTTAAGALATAQDQPGQPLASSANTLQQGSTPQQNGTLQLSVTLPPPSTGISDTARSEAQQAHSAAATQTVIPETAGIEAANLSTTPAGADNITQEAQASMQAVAMSVPQALAVSLEPQLPQHQYVAGQAQKCPAQCTMHGTCNEELGRCDCPRHMAGADCATPASTGLLEERCTKCMYSSVQDCTQAEGPSCLNNCNERGTCMGGFCKCNPGHYGADCSLSNDFQGKPQLLSGTGYTTRKKRPWVYVYELPPRLTTWMNTKRLDRGTAHFFWQRLLSSGARTADPSQADWFFIPIRQRGWGDRTHLTDAITYISHTWPFWNQTQGHRHFLFATGDLGVAEVDAVGRQWAENVTWLTYWGLTQQHNHSGWEAAHRPGRDIVVPIVISAGHYNHIGMTRSPLHPAYATYAAAKNISSARMPRSRDKTFFFAGRVCGNRGMPDNFKGPPPLNCGPKAQETYSGGVRQAVYYHHVNRTGWTVKLHERNYQQALSRHRFCLAPLGGGHGQRQVVVTTMGCIPVTIGDHVMQPFEPELPWSQFSVPVLERDVPNLHTILESISEQQVARLQAGLRCAAQHLVWSTVQGGFLRETGKYDAFETILEILRVKLLYPDARPEEYMHLDADFRRFMACGAEQLGEEPPVEEGLPALCTHSWSDGQHPPSCHLCVRGVSPSHGMPGGLICCGTKRDLSKCPRTWA